MNEQARQVLRMLRTDFRFFAPNCLKIRTKAGEVLPLKLNQAQLFIHEKLEKQWQEMGRVRAIILKGRQQGASTLIGARFYWKASGENGKKVLILTHEQAATDNLFGMTKRYHENCPDAVKPSTATENAKELWFDKLDTRYKVATAGSKGTGRGDTAQYFHGSEVAFWPNAAEHIAGIGQAVPDQPGTEIILESTANGIGNMFHQKWQDAVAGTSDYIAIFVPWYWEHGYVKQVPAGFTLDADELIYQQANNLSMGQMCWRRAKLIDDFGGDVSLFNQEYPSTPDMAFLAGSDKSLISPELVQIARRTTVKDFGGPIIIGVDPAEYGDDGSSIVVRQGRKVHEVQRHYKRGTMEVAGLVAMTIDRWKPDAVCVDVTGVGTGVADRLIEMKYRGVYRIHSGSKAIQDKKYTNKSAEMWGLMSDWIKDHPCDLPDDDSLQADLTGRQYSYDSSRRLVLEPKEKMKARGLKSPDAADALGFTFAMRISPTVTAAPKRRAPNWRVS